MQESRGIKLKRAKNSDIKNKILKILKENTSCFTSGEKISGEFGLSRAAFWKHIKHLRGDGYVIESFPRRGYRLVSVPEKLIEDNIRSGLATRILGRNEIHCFDNITSTNEVACRLAEEGALEGTIVTAESQTKGRGRMGRVWASPPGGGLYFSVILRPEMRIDEISAITLVMASAITKAIAIFCDTEPRVKWPNDIFLKKKKVSGILTETRAHPDRTDFIVLGIGVNVNTETEKLPKEATSIRSETGREVDRACLLRSILENIERYYLLFMEKGFEFFRSEVRSVSNVLGENIRIETGRKIIEGTVYDIDERGALLVKDIAGEVHRIFSGDIFTSKPQV